MATVQKTFRIETVITVEVGEGDSLDDEVVLCGVIDGAQVEMSVAFQSGGEVKEIGANIISIEETNFQYDDE